jgi:hypothetical protein
MRRLDGAQPGGVGLAEGGVFGLHLLIDDGDEGGDEFLAELGRKLVDLVVAFEGGRDRLVDQLADQRQREHRVDQRFARSGRGRDGDSRLRSRRADHDREGGERRDAPVHVIPLIARLSHRQPRLIQRIGQGLSGDEWIMSAINARMRKMASLGMAVLLVNCGGLAMARHAQPAQPAPSPAQPAAPAAEEKCGLVVDSADGNGALLPRPDIHPLSQTGQGKAFTVDAPEDASIMCQRSSIIPAANDIEVVLAGYPFYIIEKDSERIGTLEIDLGECQLRMVRGELSTAEQATLQVRMAEVQRVANAIADARATAATP